MLALIDKPDIRLSGAWVIDNHRDRRLREQRRLNLA